MQFSVISIQRALIYRGMSENLLSHNCGYCCCESSRPLTCIAMVKAAAFVLMRLGYLQCIQA
jgi:hypothetical protein